MVMNTKICTTIEQSQKLIELEIDMNTANMKCHKIVKGDIIKNRITNKTFLVVKISNNSFLLADDICPQFGYKSEITISSLYKFIEHLDKNEFNNRINRNI